MKDGLKSKLVESAKPFPPWTPRPCNVLILHEVTFFDLYRNSVFFCSRPFCFIRRRSGEGFWLGSSGRSSNGRQKLFGIEGIWGILEMGRAAELWKSRRIFKHPNELGFGISEWCWLTDSACAWFRAFVQIQAGVKPTLLWPGTWSFIHTKSNVADVDSSPWIIWRFHFGQASARCCEWFKSWEDGKDGNDVQFGRAGWVLVGIQTNRNSLRVRGEDDDL